MRMKIKKMKCENFKGQNISIEPLGRNLKIYGQNKSGKTTIVDMFSWLFFGKNSNGDTQFDIKPLDEYNNVLHGVDVTVEGVLEVESVDIHFKRVYKEKWTKKRGEENKVFSGNITDYYIDEVPKKKKEYEEYINEIINEKTFALLTDPFYFNEKLSWKERRTILVEQYSKTSDEELINNNSSLSNLVDTLSGRTVEDAKKVIKSRKDKYKKDIELLPSRIDENNKRIKEVVLSKETIELNIESAKKEIEKLNDIINKNDLTELYEINNKINESIYKLKNKLSAEEADFRNTFEQRETLARRNYIEITQKIELLKLKLTDKTASLTNINKNIEVLRTKLDELRVNYKEIKLKNFTLDEDDLICPCCKQKIDGKADELEANFNLNKVNQLEENNIIGKSTATELKEKEALQLQITKELEEMNSELKDLEDKYIKEKESIENRQAYDFTSFTNTAISKELNEAINKLEKSKVVISEVDTEEYKIKIKENEAIIDEMKDLLNALKENQNAKDRIAELMKEQSELAQKISDLEKQEFLFEEFSKIKMKALENDINNEFKNVKFKLFDIQINGGVKETCEALISGVPFSGANNGHKVVAGLEIINKLSVIYNESCPIMIDNSESVNDFNIPALDTQLIQMFVSEDKKLRMEVQ